MRIFISSPGGDLLDARASAVGAVRAMGFDAYAFESHGAEAVPPISRCLEEVRRCDALIAILGGEYGTIAERDEAIPFADGETSISEIELRSAELLGKPILIYIMQGIEAEARQQQLIESVHGLYAQSTLARFDDPAQLTELVVADLARLVTQLVRGEYRHPVAGMPTVHVFPTAQEAFRGAASAMLEVLSEKRWPILSLGAGRTTAGVYDALVALATEAHVPGVDQAGFIAQTEYLGYLPDHPNSCSSHLRGSLIDKLRDGQETGGRERDIFLPSAIGSGTLGAACGDIDARLNREMIHVSVFGVSPAGEILCIDGETARRDDALSMGASVVELSEEARQYVSPRPALPYVITIGLRSLVRSERLIAVMVGSIKADVLQIGRAHV